MVALLAALWAALLLLGLDVPSPRTDFAEVHGPLMVLGFLGTLISLERAAAVDVRLGYLTPILSGLAALATIIGILPVGKVLFVAAGIGLVGLYGVAAHRQNSVHLAVMAVGAMCWIVAAVLWSANWDVGRLVPWLAGFLVLTITGERLELARMTQLDRTARFTFVEAASLFTVGLVLSTIDTSLGTRIAGIGMLAFAVWLFGYDVTRRTIRTVGLTRYMAVCLLAGYGWLAAAGALWLRFGTLTDGRAFDAMLHAVFLGFVIGMVFAHAPVIVPAVFRVEVPYRRYFYGHVLLLHASLVLRVVGGDGFGNRASWQLGGVLNEVALLGFIVATVVAIRSGRSATRHLQGATVTSSRSGREEARL